jgi:hypothetical protein
MNRFAKLFLVLIVIIGITFSFANVVQASNSLPDDENPEDIADTVATEVTQEVVPEGQGGAATPTPIRVRMNGTVKAYYTASVPVIDGDWGDWSAPENPARFVVVGGQNRSGTADLDASYKLAWDENNLYVAAKIRDDKYVQNARIDQLYKGDSIEILFDSEFYTDFDNATLNNDDYQLGINPGHTSPSGPKEAYVWYPANQVGPRDDIDIATLRSWTKGITRIEVAIPWTTFNVVPETGAHYGFAFGVSDNDDPVRDQQQTFLSNIRKRALANPTTWGDLTLMQ